jgi:hypothetical protein
MLKSDGDDSLTRTRLAQVVEDRKRIGQQRVCRRALATRPVPAVVQGNHLVIRKEPVQRQSHCFRVPGVPAKPYERRHGPARLSYARYSYADQGFSIWCPDLDALC